MPVRLLLLLVTAPTVVVLLAAPSSACSCAGGTDAEHLARATAVFEGEVLARHDPPRGLPESSSEPAAYEVAVDRVYKGDVARRVEVVTASSGASCGLELPANGRAVFFAQGSGASVQGQLCDGTRVGAADTAVVGEGTPPPPPAAAAVPPPAPPSPAASVTGPAVVAGALAGGVLVAGWVARRVRRHFA